MSEPRRSAKTHFEGWRSTRRGTGRSVPADFPEPIYVYAATPRAGNRTTAWQIAFYQDSAAFARRICKTEFLRQFARNATGNGTADRRPCGAMAKELPVELKVWVDCSRCGRVERLIREFRLPLDEATSRLEKVTCPCEQCGVAAYMYFQRSLFHIH